MSNLRSFLILVLSYAFLFSCNPDNKYVSRKDELVTHIDSTIIPGDDFFMYANGKWFRDHPIPSSEAQNGLWQMIQDTVNSQVLKICQSSAAMVNAEKGSIKQKIGDFYLSGMDSVTINNKGIDELKNEIRKIDAIQKPAEIARITAYLQALGSGPIFRFSVSQDDRISSKMAVFIAQGGLSLPDRSLYVDKDPGPVLIRKEFRQHLKNMFAIIGYNDDKAGVSADNVIKLETSIALTSRKREDTRDPFKNYNKMPFSQLTGLAPLFDWSAFMEGSGLNNVDTVIVGQPEFITALNVYLRTFPLETWKDYLKYHLVHNLSGYLDGRTFEENFSFYFTTLRGIREPRPRWKRVVSQTDQSLGELIGQVYVEEYLPKGTREKLIEIGNAVKEEYATRIGNLEWMSEITRQKALHKLNAVIMKLGNPDKWKDMSTMSIDRSSYIHNVMNANRWQFNHMISKFGKPVDRNEWDMQPQTYNAYYNPSNNEIVIPGCNIIIPGYENQLPDDALLYSVIGGSTFGHEIIHGFDDQGCKYDENGNLGNWWTREDSIKFYEKTSLIVEQFNNYIAVDSLHLNGENTQGENIADLGGLVMAYNAFKKTSQYKKGKTIGGLNPDQRFFLGYALSWMINQRRESLILQVKSDEHSPAKFRVNGPLSNFPEFYKAFGLTRENRMWRPEGDRIEIW
jgi:putative endopeptidase